jgi:hypothetical protein
MAEGVGNAVKYGLAGLVVGTATGSVTDMIYSKIGGYIAWSGEGNVSKSAVSVIVAGSVAAAFMFGGDMLLESAFDVAQDPLFRVMFYQSAFISQSTVKVAITGVRSLIGGVVSGAGGNTSPKIPVMGPQQMPGVNFQAQIPPPPSEDPMRALYGGPSNCPSGGAKMCGQNRVM